MLPSEGDLAWLLGDRAPPPGRLASRLELAGACALVLSFWQVLGWTAPRLAAAAAPGHPEELEVVEAVARAVALHTTLQERLLLRLGAAMDTAGLPHVVLKGCALRRVAWAFPEARASWDIDLGVARPALAHTESVVRALGFSPAVRERPTGRFVPAPVVFRAILESKHYELCTMVRETAVPDLTQAEVADLETCHDVLGPLLWDRRGDRWIARTAIDLHHAVDPRVPLEPVLATRERVDGVWVPARPWLVVHAARTLHRESRREGARVLHHLADLLRLLPTPADACVAFADTLPTLDVDPVPALRDALRRGRPSAEALLALVR